MKYLGLLLLAGLLLWMYLRQQQRRRRFDAGDKRLAGPAQRHRIGTPGTIAPEQVAALEAISVRPSSDWSEEEAALILDAVDYAEAAWRATVADADPPRAALNKLMGTILIDAGLRETVRRWGEARRAAAGDPAPAPGDDDAWRRVCGEVRKLAAD